MKKLNSLFRFALLGLIAMATKQNILAQQTISASFNSNSQSRSYIGAVPNSPQGPLRLVILFCGAGENATQMVARGYNNYLGNHSMVVYPEPSSPAGFDNSMGVNDFQMVEDLISHLDSNYNINLADICIGGFSNGAIFSYNLVCDFNSVGSSRAYTFKSFAIVSGAMENGKANTTNCPIAGNIPLIAFHGTQDPIISYNGTFIQPPVGIVSEQTDTTIAFWANVVNACSSTPTSTTLPNVVIESPNSTVERREYSACLSLPHTVFYRITGGFHAWPSGNANIDITQSRNMDINASQLISNFFNSQSTVSLSERELNSDVITVYPNPFNNELNLNANSEIISIEIVNGNGKNVYSATKPNRSITLEHLSPGLYFLRIETAEGRLTKKITKIN